MAQIIIAATVDVKLKMNTIIYQGNDIVDTGFDPQLTKLYFAFAIAKEYLAHYRDTLSHPSLRTFHTLSHLYQLPTYSQGHL